MPDGGPKAGGLPIGQGGLSPDLSPPGGEPIEPAVFATAGPIRSAGAPGSGGAFIAAPGVPPAGSAPLAPPEIFTAGNPIGGPATTFNIGGAPIAILGGVFRGGLPLGGPVTQIFRGGSAPLPPTLFIATISPAGPIADFFIGTGGSPIGVATFGGGGLPIGPPQQVAVQVAQIEPRTAEVGGPAVVFREARADQASASGQPGT